jgi:small subunit ribosomal protein S8
MNNTDPISNMLTVIRNGNKAQKIKVDVPFSKLSEEILNILRQEKFVKDFKLIEEEKHEVIRIYLKYSRENLPAIKGIKRISKPSIRIYVKKDKIPVVCGGLGIAVLSTSRGVVTNIQAKEMQTGGEVLCYVW